MGSSLQQADAGRKIENKNKMEKAANSDLPGDGIVASISETPIERKRTIGSLQLSLLVNFHPEIALFRNLSVNLRNHLCGVPFVRLRIIP
jgi:hypothetical protein